MNRSIEQALLSLLPTYNGELPQPLVDLAGSLLAQSRHRASTLKADEEIARPYACAHIACDRLKISLDLPPIEPRPPVPPRIYKRLYTHLGIILPSPSARNRSTPVRVRTPNAKVRGLGEATNDDTTPSRSTSTREQTLAAFRTKIGRNPGTPSKLSRHVDPRSASGGAESKLPPWIRPTIRLLCKELDTVAMGPSVLAGMEAIVVPHGRKTKDAWVINNLTALLASLYLYVWGCASVPEGIDEKRYASARGDVVKALSGIRKLTIVKDMDEETVWEGWQHVEAASIDKATVHLNRHGMLDGDWAKDIDGLFCGSHHNYAAEPEDSGVEGLQTSQLRRIDTMHQDHYDFLSEKKREDYALWKRGILQRIESMQHDEQK